MSSAARVGILGGTFDPIHLGHLAAARAAAARLQLDRVLFVPSGRPPHRPDRPVASGYHRFAMLALAVAHEPGWQTYDGELLRDGTTYTFDTLSALRHAEPESQFFFITGADAFAEIATWWRYPDVLNLASFVVVSRTGGTSFDTLRARLPQLVSRMTTLADDVPAVGLPTGTLPIVLVPAETPDISSTRIRQRAAAGESLSGLIPEAVAAYVAAQRLYV